MAVTIDTSTYPSATSTGRKLLSTSDGVLWAMFQPGSNLAPELWYSTDQGASWTQSATAFPTNVLESTFTWVIDDIDKIHILYRAASGSRLNIRRGTLNGDHTDIAWSAATQLDGAINVTFPSIVAHQEGTSRKIHCVYIDRATDYVFYRRGTWTSGGSFSWDAAREQISTAIAQSLLEIDFNHVEADPRLIQDSTPHLYVAWRNRSTGTRLQFRRATYSGGSWTWETIRDLDGADNQSNTAHSAIFYGDRYTIVKRGWNSPYPIQVRERNAADTTTYNLPNPPARTGTSSAIVSVSYRPGGDIEIWHADYIAERLQRTVFDRSANTWSAWETIDTGNDDESPNLKRGYWSGSAADSIDGIWLGSRTSSPYDIQFERFTLAAPPSAAAGWGRIPIGG